jgi:hypothetical protein
MILKKNIYLFLFLGIIVSQKLFSQNRISEISLPVGYTRIHFAKNSYSHYIQNLPLKADNSILEWSGSKLRLSSFLYNVLAVVDKPILFKEDLEQCADYSMRFWADYHKENNKLSQLFLYNYSGTKKLFKNSKKSYLKYLRWHMAFSNSFSVKSGAQKISKNKKLRPGDMFVQNKNGGIGHVSVVVDAAENKNGKRIYLIGYSYMPAQEFHIEDAENISETEAWFTKEAYIKYLDDTKLSHYGKAVLRRF